MTDDIWNDDGAWIILMLFCALFGKDWPGEEETAQRLD